LNIEPLTDLTPEDVRRLIVGYDSMHRYDVRWDESPDRTSFELTLVDLDEPFIRRWKHEHMTDWYRSLLVEQLSFGARDGERLAGLAITESRWNDEAMIWELHVEERQRGRGLGRRLLTAVEDAAREKGLRATVLETQTTNVAAIGFYRACGYQLRAVDLSFYENDDLARGEVAVFMKKPLR
jgi:ribosomal protein S18 acetylase RimI-like enzyme